MTSMAASTITWPHLRRERPVPKDESTGSPSISSVRVPTIVVSPLIPRNLIDHRPYEHSSIIATVARLFDLKELARSSFTSDLKPLARLDVPRADAPMTLP